MEWVWNKNELARIWPHLVSISERKSQNPTANPALNFVQVRVQDDLIHFKATDLEVQLDHTLSWPGLSSGHFLIPGRKFWDICRNLPDDAAIKLSVEPGEKIRLVAGKSRFTLASLPFETYPELPSWDDVSEGFEMGGSDLKNVLEAVSFASSEQDSRLYLNGVLWDISHEKLTVVASDGHRLAEASFPLALQQALEKRVIVPRRSILDLCRMLAAFQDKTIRVAFSEQSLILKTAGFCFAVRLIDSRYPDHHKFFPIRPPYTVAMPLQAFKQALQRVSILTDTHPIVTLAFSDQHLELKTDNPGHEEAVEELSVPYTGPDCLLRLNIRYCLEFLNSLGSEVTDVNLSLTSPESALLFEVPGAFQIRYVLMPFRR